MKKLLFTLSTALMVSASFGQITVSIAPHIEGDTIPSIGMHHVAYFTNSGSAAIPAGDTLWYWLEVDGAALSFGGAAGQISGTILQYDLAPGARIERAAQLNFLAGVTTTTYQEICTRGTIGISNTPTAASACYVINRSFVSTPEITLEETTKVFVAHGMLNLSSTKNDNLLYSVISITGQTVSQGNFVNNKQVDLSGVAKGIYAVVLTNGTEKITKKVAVQ